MADQVTLKDTYKETRIFRVRFAVAGLALVALLGVLVARYSDLQINDYEIYRTASDRNRVQLLPVPPKRGLMFDRNGVLLAENVPSYSLTLVVERVDDLDAVLDTLGELVDISPEDVDKFRQRLSRRRPYQPVPLKFRLSEEEIATLAVNRHRLPGVDVDAQLVRHYPHGELFAHVLGYVGRINEREQAEIDPINYSGTEHIGKIGLEKYYEDELHGRVGSENVETNARGRVLRVLERTDPSPGKDLVLNLDLRVQQAAFDALGAERGAVVAIDPRDGGVLALVSTPSFDANLFVNGISSADYSALRDNVDLPLFNRALQGQYPPGSTVKPFYALAGLYYGTVTEESRVYDPGWYQLPNDERLYRDWKKGGHGTWVRLNQSIVESCDVYYYDLAFRLGIDRLSEFTARFGMGVETGIDNTNERPGLLPSRAWKRANRNQAWFPGETLSAGIGQGYVLATPLQLAHATAMLANRGVGYVPRLLRTLGEVPQAPERNAPVSDVDEAHWRAVIQAMEDTVHTRRGTGNRIGRDAPYRIGGKTGTAQVVGIAQDAEYDASQLIKRQWDHALFVAFAPVDNPRIAVAVIVENGEHGSSVAAPVARKVMDAWLLREGEAG
ncbi:MAG TPA: penicillin-binding protein 2 [Spongiibacteraceae bacterium]|nr:penicillin-binding protein 2 [Spongiibacteraceae bacterium]